MTLKTEFRKQREVSVSMNIPEFFEFFRTFMEVEKIANCSTVYNR